MTYPDTSPSESQTPADGRLARLLAKAPAILWILRGPEHVIEFASELARQSVGDHDSLVGRPIREALPEIAGQELFALLDGVFTTGRPFVDPGRRVLLPQTGEGMSEGFFSFAIDPVTEDDGLVSGVMVHAVEVSELVLARRTAERASGRLQRIERIARAFGRAVEPAEVGAIAVEEGARAMGADAGLLFQLDGRGWLDMLAASGYEEAALERWRRFPIGMPAPVSDAIAARGIVAVESPAEIEERYPNLRGVRPVTSASVIAAPLIVGDEVMGGLSFAFSEARRFPPEERLLVSAMAAHCSVALQRATLQTDQREVAAREILLGEISHGLDSPLDVDGRLRRLVSLVVPRLADLATVRVVQPDGGSRLVATAHADPVLAEVARRAYGSEAAATAETGPNRVIATGTAELVEQTDDASRLAWAPDEESLAALRLLDTRSYLSVPLTARGQTHGVLTLQNGASRRPFGRGDLAVCTEIGRRAGLALDNARLFEAERETARVLQRRLLPERLPAMTITDLAVRYLPAAEWRAGGDFYGGVQRADGTVCLMVGDVVGHGIEAAATMGQLRSAWRALTAVIGEPARILQRLSDFAAGVQGAAMTTVVCAALEPDGRIRYACAGHPPPLVITDSGRAAYLTDGRGVPLHCGIERQEEGEIRLAPGTSVLFYTDGVIERRFQSIDEGLDTLRTVARARHALDPEEFLDEVVAIVCADAEDDCALLACRYSGGSAGTPGG